MPTVNNSDDPIEQVAPDLVLAQAAGNLGTVKVLAALHRGLEAEAQTLECDKARLRENQERLSGALAASGAGTFCWEMRTNAVSCDENLNRLFGLQPAAPGRSLDELIRVVHPGERAAVIAGFEQSARQGADFEQDFRVVWPDGSIRWLCDKGKTYFGEHGKPAYLAGACIDITNRKVAEQALRDTHERWRFLIQKMPVLLWITSAEGYATYANERLLAYAGQNLDELMGEGWMRVIHPEDLPRVRKIWYGSIAVGEDYELEYRMKRAADGQFRWHLGRGWAVRDPDGGILKWFNTSTDIHDLRETEEALRRSNEDLQHFAYAISHDLKEPLRSIRSFSDLALARESALDPELAEYLRFIAGGAARMHRLLQDLLSYSSLTRGRADRSMPVDLESVLHWTLENLRSAIDEAKAEVTCDSLPFVKGDFARLAQVFQNLVANAIGYRVPGRPPRIHISAERSAPGEWQIVIQDNCSGIDPRYHETIFMPFKRLESGTKTGLGLGLAIVRRSIEQHGGRVWVESEPGQGSRFCFTLPVL
jgi:PAS domain S-box-containing protein